MNDNQDGFQEVRVLEDPRGRVPFAEWLSGIRDPRTRVAVLTRVDRLSLGLVGDAKAVGEGVVELRIHRGPGIRIYVGRVGDGFRVILGGTKRTQSRDVAKAQRLWREYREDGSQ